MRIGRFSGALPLVLMTVADRRGRRVRDRPPGRVPHELQPQQPAAPDDAARARLARTDVRAARRRLRRLGGGAHDVLRRRRVLHDDVRHSRGGRCFPGAWRSSRWAWRPGSSTPCSSACSSFRRSSRRSGRSASSRARRSSSAITPKGPISSDAVERSHDERQLRSGRLHRRRRPRRRSATCGCTARGRASPRGRSASTRRRRAGSGWQPAASCSSRSSSAR